MIARTAGIAVFAETFMWKRKIVPHGPSRAPAPTASDAVRPIYVGEGLDPPAQTAPPHSLKPHVETQIVPFFVILSERSESKDLRIIDTAKILRLPLVAQDDRIGALNLFA